jgi:hypothetical protein
MAWEILYIVGAVVLALALVYGLTRNLKRNRAQDARTEAATRDIYDNPPADPDTSPLRR